MKKVTAAIVTLLLLLLCGAAPAFGSDGRSAPIITGDGIYLATQEGRPYEIGFDTEGRLDTAIPPGATLYFQIDNATIAEHLNGYRPFIRVTYGEEYIEGDPMIRYLELYDSEGMSKGYHYTVQVRFADGTYDEPIEILARVRISRNSTSTVGEFRFMGVLQEEPLEQSVAYISCEHDVGVVGFDDESSFAYLSFGDAGSFFVRTDNQRDLDLSYAFDRDDRIAMLYPEAEFIFLRFIRAPVFDYVGTLAIYAPEELLLYEITLAGLGSPTYRYSEEEGCFIINTRTLGDYLLSSIPLPENIWAGVKGNPPTGAEA